MGEGIEASIACVTSGRMRIIAFRQYIVSTLDRNRIWKILLNLMTYDGVCGNLGRSVGKIGGKIGKNREEKWEKKKGNLREFSSNLCQGLMRAIRRKMADRTYGFQRSEYWISVTVRLQRKPHKYFLFHLRCLLST